MRENTLKIALNSSNVKVNAIVAVPHHKYLIMSLSLIA